MISQYAVHIRLEPGTEIHLPATLRGIADLIADGNDEGEISDGFEVHGTWEVATRCA